LDEAQTGCRREGIFTSVMGFMSKLEISFSYLAVGYLLAWAGLDTKLPTQSPEVLQRLFWFCIVPNILFTFGGLIFSLLFPVSEAQAAATRRLLDERRWATASDLSRERTQRTQGI